MIVVRSHFRKGKVVRSHKRTPVYRMENSIGLGPFNKNMKSSLSDSDYVKYRKIVDSYHERVPTVGVLGGMKDYVFGYADKKSFSKNLGSGGVKFLKSIGFKINKYSPLKTIAVGQGIAFKK